MMSLRFCVIPLTIIQLVCCTPCNISTDNRTADCSYRHLSQIPKLSRQTEYLDLTGNNFKTLRNSSFEHLPNLKTLNLRNCSIDHIDGQVFAVLEKLQNLTMSENRINILHKRFGHLRFNQNPFLTHLDLSKNNKFRLHKAVPSVYPDKVFGSLTSLQVLITDLLPNPVFGKGFSNLTNITSLIFRDCAILHLKNNTFEYFENLTKLTFLEMSNCQVHIFPWVKVERAVLQYFHALQHLDLSGTMITFPVAMDILYGLTVTTNQSHPVRKMKFLNLYNVNPLKLLWMYDVSYTVKLTKEVAKYYKHLCIEDVNIGKNGIVEVDVDALESFIDNSCLKRFVMRENNFLLTFPKFMFAIVKFILQAVNLQEIDYSYIAIQFSDVSENQAMETSKRSLTIEEERYRCTLPIRSNHLSHIYISHLLFPFSILCDIDVSYLPMLTYLDMSHMTVADMDFKIIGANLSYFDVSGMDFGSSGSRLLGNLNGVTRLLIRDANLDRAFSNRNYIFRNISRIEELDMSSNHLNSLPDESLEGLEGLKKINLSLNFLKEFPHGLFKMKNLSYIDLRHNKLLFLDKATTDWLDGKAKQSVSGITVLLYDNPFTCTCDTEDFVSWIIKTNVSLEQTEPANFNCTLKDGSNTNIAYVYSNRDTVFRNCNDHLFWLQFSISAISLVILAIVFAAFGHTFRWRILYFFYRNCKIKQGMEDTTSYSYDLFVAYTAADSPWIWQQLRPTLELKHNIPLCLHERDFEIGESISQNIVNFLQKSKKILFVISTDYINSRWCDFELEMANMERVQRGLTNSIIVVIKGDVPVGHMPRPIRNIWQQITCIIYPLDETDNDAFELFWCRLRHSIVS